MFRHLSPKAVHIIDRTARKFAKALGEPVSVTYRYSTKGEQIWVVFLETVAQIQASSSYTAMLQWVEVEARRRAVRAEYEKILFRRY